MRMRKVHEAIIMDRQKSKSKFPGDPTLRRKCPKCGGTSYTISAPIANVRSYIAGILVEHRKGRFDAGSFQCDVPECGYKETV